MTSCINIFIYEVYGVRKNLNSKYSFSGLVLKNKNNKKNNLIIPANNNKSIITNTTKIFSRDIIRNKKESNLTDVSNIIETKNNLMTLYKLYREYPARAKIENIDRYITNNFFTTNMRGKIYNIISQLCINCKDVLAQYLQNQISINNIQFNINRLTDLSEIIYTIEEDYNAKIIVMGDNHGSFHSFFRIFIRLFIDGIIDNNYNLKQDYKIIFLGDIVDRGFYSLEILYIILQLMEKK